MTSIPDHVLVRKSRKGDAGATRQLYERHEAWWFRICLRYSRSRSEAQDLFQEGVMKVFEHLEKFDPSKGSFPGWSNTIVVRESIRFLKSAKWQDSFADLSDLNDPVAEGVPEIHDELSAKELIELIQKLPFGYRLVFNLYEIEGYSHREIAKLIGISEGTSKSQLAKARKAIRQHIKLLFE